MGLAALGRFEEAIAACDKAIALAPDFAAAHTNRGNALRTLTRLEEALASYDRVIGLTPDSGEAHFCRGNVLADLNRHAEALASFDRALVLRPNNSIAWNNRAVALQEQGRISEAIADYRRAVAVDPGCRVAHSNLLLCLHYDSEATPLTLWQDHLAYAAGLGNPPVLAHANPRERHRRLRIGYVSPDFREHSVAFFAGPLIAAHDRRAVEIFCYAEIGRPDATTRRFQDAADHWIEHPGPGRRDRRRADPQ